MKNYSLRGISFLSIVSLVILSACSSSSSSGPDEVTAIMVSDLPANAITIFSPSAPQTDLAGDTAQAQTFTYYDLDTGSIITDAASIQWDIAFGSLEIIANSNNGGGILVVDTDYASTQTAPETGYESGTRGWYDYTAERPGVPPHAVLPYEDKTIVVRTADNRYAKVQILSYYEGNPDTDSEEFLLPQARPTSPMFTFNYTIQNDGSTQLYHEESTTYYDLDENVIVEDPNSSQWDVAFNQTTITANEQNGGGIQLLNIAFADVDEAPTAGYTGTNTNWYTYTGEAPTGPQRAVLPNDGQTLVVLTPEGKYAKIRILSYYEGNPDVTSQEFISFFTRPEERYYTFEFGIQADGSRFFE